MSNLNLLQLSSLAKWWNGRHEGFKIPCMQVREGSTPSFAIKSNRKGNYE